MGVLELSEHSGVSLLFRYFLGRVCLLGCYVFLCGVIDTLTPPTYLQDI
jgi:hypothetical protein